jgi:hypothetical protein
MAIASCSLLAQALCFHHRGMPNEPLAFEDVKICGLDLKLYFQ